MHVKSRAKSIARLAFPLLDGHSTEGEIRGGPKRHCVVRHGDWISCSVGSINNVAWRFVGERNSGCKSPLQYTSLVVGYETDAVLAGVPLERTPRNRRLRIEMDRDAIATMKPVPLCACR
jgi:hypothetical protein